MTKQKVARKTEFLIHFPERTLTVDEIWPNGGAPENPSAADVVKALGEEAPSGRSRVSGLEIPAWVIEAAAKTLYDASPSLETVAELTPVARAVLESAHAAMNPPTTEPNASASELLNTLINRKLISEIGVFGYHDGSRAVLR
jgi:hypothetical protein